MVWQEFVLLAIIALLLFWGQWRSLAESVAEALNNFRGGPPGMHPLPANDAWLILKRRQTATMWRSRIGK